MPETELPATDLDLIGFLKAIPGTTRRICASRVTACHSTLFTFRSGHSGLGFYTRQKDAANLGDALPIRQTHPPPDVSLDRLAVTTH